ncbi:short chain dehydrogenase/reductase family protein [Gottschalkia purinilytica]|uniref:Short chain dehydrogenase/reductase family protein n=1 Tax=Gottschalkia purinilytica TaxID=1503 RepID=A0A0L0W834_GOTPU|nr:SDR family oxidoreductase [Gottschalkia purinilytica]KNF07601.1 short chain dehydrogenase/reductase family protein [Gottschalkia purinilytica]
MYPVYPYLGWETKCKKVPITFPPQHQNRQPGIESKMIPRPIYNNPYYYGSRKLINKVALITGGDSGIGRAVAVAFAKEKADVAIVYLYERCDALETKAAVEALGRRCLIIKGDIRRAKFCNEAVEKTLHTFGRLDILVNNAGVQFPQDSILDISNEQLENTFRTNIFSFFYMTKAALPYLDCGSSIINTSSITAYEGEETLIDYSSTKGAIVSFTRSLSKSLVEKGIRVNAVAPGPVWTPLIPSSFSANRVKTFGSDTPMKRAAQPFELAPTYVFLASDDSSYITGQMIHVNGGRMVTS